MGKCEHLWQQTSKVCPYGFKLPMDVTWPDAARARSFGMPDHELATNQVWIFVNVLYSYVPAVMMAVQLVRLVVVRGSRELCIASVLVFTFILNELILKHIFSVPRPEESCCTSCGMPSSHSAFAASLLGFHLCDLLWRLSSRPFPWVNRDDVAESVLEVLRAACRHWDELDALQCGLISLFWSLLLIPVPFTRVILGDHSIEQVLLGSLVGFSASLIVWIAARTFLKNHNHHLDDEQFCGGWRLISHNMALPISSLFRRMQHQQLRPQELQWYLTRVTNELERCRSTSAARPCNLKRFEEIKKILEAQMQGVRNEDFDNIASVRSSSREANFPSIQVMLSEGNRSHVTMQQDGTHRNRATWHPGNFSQSSEARRMTFSPSTTERNTMPFLSPQNVETVAGQSSNLAPAMASFSSTHNNVDGVAHGQPVTSPADSFAPKTAVSFSSTQPVESFATAGAASFKVHGPEISKDAGGASEVEVNGDPCDPSKEHRHVLSLNDAEHFREELRTFLEGKEGGSNFVLRDRHGTPIPIDDVEETSISIDRFPLHLSVTERN